MKSNDFRNYTIGDIEKICEKSDHCDECEAKIICDCLNNMLVSWAYTVKRAEQEMKMDE